LDQVIVNLALNARDAMPNGGTLSLGTAGVTLDDLAAREISCPGPGEYVTLAVSDTGSGMSTDVQQHLLEPFFTTKGIGRGTGLGLATVYGIVQQSGGSIRVESELGKVTTITIYLPQVGEDVAAQAAGTEPVRGGTETLLIVEDQESVRQVTARVLRRCGYTVLEASNGVEALRVARSRAEPIHLVLTDVVMPEMGGKELAERVRALRDDCKILYMSGYTDRPANVLGAETLDADYVQKPFSPEELERKVRRALDGDR
jgi:two-component system, cell cycle sensor histidine kinase and response regulator CckA